MARRTSTSETALKQKALAFLREHYPGVWWKNHGGIYSGSGLPDIMGVHQGRLFALELKAPGRYRVLEAGLTELQKAMLDHLAEAGAIVGVIDNLDYLKRLMREATQMLV